MTDNLPFRYALVHRPPGIGAVPMEKRFKTLPRPEKGQPHHDLARHGIICYAEPLDPQTLNAFEFGLMIDDHSELAQALSQSFEDVGNDVVELAETQKEALSEMILSRCAYHVPTDYFSLADPDGLVNDVIASLSEKVLDRPESGEKTSDQPKP